MLAFTLQTINRMTMKYFLTVFSFFFILLLSAQKGSISGKLLDGNNNEGIFNAKISIKSIAKGVISDQEGKFSFTELTPGIYTIEIKATTYNNKIITDIAVVSGKDYYFETTLESVVTEYGTITKVHTIKRDTDLGLLQAQKASLVVLDGTTQEQLKRTPDKTVGDALKRISGASIQDNKFAVIRGLNDRYNAAYLNGSPLPSSEGDRKAFAFDIFPVNMLDNLTIVKTASPDMPSEFAGGIIQVKTKDIPTENFQSISFGGGINTITTFQSQVKGQTGKLDWLGIDDGSRAMPNSIPSSKDFPVLMNDQASLAKTFNFDWGLKQAKFSPNASIQYAAGFKKILKNESEFGFIGSVSYNKTNNFNETVRRSYTDNAAGGTGSSQMETDYLDKVYSTQILAGSMANFALKINATNSISFKNLYSINSDNRIISRSGAISPLDVNPTLIKSNATWFTSNNIYSGQLGGNHSYKENKLKLDWVAALSTISRTIPNLKRSIYTRSTTFNDPSNPMAEDTMYIANIAQSNVGPDYGGSMFFSTNKEQIYSGKVNLAYQIKEKKGWRTEMKVGAMYQYRNRDFVARQFGYTKYGAVGGSVNFDQNLLFLPVETIFSPEHMGLISPGVGGFKLTEGTKASDSYSANSNLKAAYISTLHSHKKFKLLYGIRLEDFTQNLNSIKADKSELNVKLHNLDVLPSFNLIYSPSTKVNVRLSGSQTLNRPEYRELAPFAFYDFNTQFVLSGNDSLERAKITNLDMRYEVYPASGQLLSATIFYKYFQNPIEQIARADVMNEISYKNVPTANNFGLELEFKGTIGSFFKADSSSPWNNLSLFANLGIVRSIVDVSQNIGTPYQTRPLQGQSPYIINAGLNYKTENNYSFSMNLNRVGPRIYILGSVLQPDIWEKSRTFLDFQVAKTMAKDRLELKINVQNILAQNLVFYQNNYGQTSERNIISKLSNITFLGDADGENSFDATTDDLVWSTKFGRTISFVLTYKF